MKRFYYLSTCDTCKRIMGELNLPASVEKIDIKYTNIDEQTLDWLKDKVGSYEALFSKKAMKYRGLGLHEMKLQDTDFRKYMLEEYTFLKRPFLIYDDHVWIGNAKKDVQDAVAFFQQHSV